MKTRAQIYEREAAALLRDISMYRVMAEKQLLLLHPGKEDKVKSLLSYLVRQGRIWQADGFYCAAQDSLEELDRGLLASLSQSLCKPLMWCRIGAPHWRF